MNVYAGRLENRWTLWSHRLIWTFVVCMLVPFEARLAIHIKCQILLSLKNSKKRSSSTILLSAVIEFLKKYHSYIIASIFCDVCSFMSFFSSAHCESCEPGTYQNESGQSNCINCEAGYYSAQGMSRCSRCEPDEYSLNDGSGCTTCADATECPCLVNGTCFTKDICFNLGAGSHKCGACPAGYDGDGITCTDIDEVKKYHIYPIYIPVINFVITSSADS